MVVTLANVLLRQANNQSNARQWLLDLQTSKFDDVNAQNGQITATTVNGKSMTLQAIPGISLASFIAATELALSALEHGLNRVPRQTYSLLR